MAGKAGTVQRRRTRATRRIGSPEPSRGMRAYADARTRVLVVGSLPGQASLAARQYYAQPQNSFWRVIEDLCGVPRTLPYAQRVAALLERGIGVWDVCASAHRPGSLDSSIARESIVANNFARLYRRYPGIGFVCFNGATAAALYRRLVLPTLDAAAAQIRYVVLPSTSPAHASMRYAEKLDRWRAVTTAAAARCTP
jgi:hypoxanthine-DNA glycosylase